MGCTNSRPEEIESCPQLGEASPMASSTPVQGRPHRWLKLMEKYHLTLEEVTEHAFVELLPLEQREQVKFEPSTRVKAGTDTISVTLTGDEAQRFHHLVVAANPRELMGYGLSVPAGTKPDKILTMVPTAEEAAIYSPEGEMYNTYFQTTVLRVPAPASPTAHIVAFRPESITPAKGDVAGYRNETRKTYWLKDKPAEEYLTFYQLSDPKYGPVTKAALKEKFETFINCKTPPAWWPYKLPLKGPLGQIETVFNTPYFNRFSAKSLKAGLPWKLLDLQGKHNTTFTHASSCFESVLHIYLYLQMLDAQGGLPADPTAKVAIVGAGPSGLLSAHLLVKKGFKDITIFEKNHNPDEDQPSLYAGKTRTHVIELNDADKETVTCEMGTCYLSPSYKPMVDDLQAFFNGTMYGPKGKGMGNVFPIDQNPVYDPKFRCMITDGQFLPNGPVQLFANLLGGGKTVPAVTHKGVTPIDQPMDFGEYVILKAMEETCHGPPQGPLLEVEADWALKKLETMAGIPLDMHKYDILHKKYLGDCVAEPFPAKQPSPTTMTHLTMTFYEWLQFHDLKRMVGFLQYGYEIQGYGSLTTIPVWYGLMWIQPSTIRQSIEDNIGKMIVPGYKAKGEVFALKKGWGQVWDNMRPALQEKGVKFQWSADITSIERLDVKPS